VGDDLLTSHSILSIHHCTVFWFRVTFPSRTFFLSEYSLGGEGLLPSQAGAVPFRITFRHLRAMRTQFCLLLVGMTFVPFFRYDTEIHLSITPFSLAFSRVVPFFVWSIHPHGHSGLKPASELGIFIIHVPSPPFRVSRVWGVCYMFVFPTKKRLDLPMRLSSIAFAWPSVSSVFFATIAIFIQLSPFSFHKPSQADAPYSHTPIPIILLPRLSLLRSPSAPAGPPRLEGFDLLPI